MYLILAYCNILVGDGHQFLFWTRSRHFEESVWNEETLCLTNLLPTNWGGRHGCCKCATALQGFPLRWVGGSKCQQDAIGVFHWWGSSSPVFFGCCYLVVNSTSMTVTNESPSHITCPQVPLALLKPHPGDQPPSLASTLACFGEVHRCGLCDRRTTSIASPPTSLDLPRQSMLGEKTGFPADLLLSNGLWSSDCVFVWMVFGGCLPFCFQFFVYMSAFWTIAPLFEVG